MEKVNNTVARFNGSLQPIQTVAINGTRFVVKHLQKGDKVGIATGQILSYGKIKDLSWDELISMSTGKTEDGKFWVIEDENARIVFDQNKAYHGKMNIYL